MVCIIIQSSVSNHSIYFFSFCFWTIFIFTRGATCCPCPCCKSSVSGDTFISIHMTWYWYEIIALNHHDSMCILMHLYRKTTIIIAKNIYKKHYIYFTVAANAKSIDFFWEKEKKNNKNGISKWTVRPPAHYCWLGFECPVKRKRTSDIPEKKKWFPPPDFFYIYFPEKGHVKIMNFFVLRNERCNSPASYTNSFRKTKNRLDSFKW